MGRTACTEPQCLYKGALYLYTAILYFSTSSHTRNHFRQNVTELKMCVFWFCCVKFVRNISYSKKNWARYVQKNELVFIKSTRYSCPLQRDLNFLDRFPKKYSNIKFHENPSRGPELFTADWRPDGRTYMTKLTVAFLNFAKAPINYFTLCNAVGCVHKTNAPNFTELRRNRIGQ